jgi:hypothetical protein
MRVNPMFSYGPDTLSCSTQTCWAGGEFYYNGPFTELEGYVTIPTAPSSTPTKFSGWQGLFNCTWSSCPTAQVLDQSGFEYGSAFNGTSPNMFVELVGNFYWNSHYCLSVYCGYQIKETAGDQLYMSDFYSSVNWVAYVQDNTANNTPYTLVQDSGSNVGVTGSVPYALVSIEAAGASSNSYITTPVDFTSLYVQGTSYTQVNIDSSNMYSYVGNTASSGVSASYSATGTSTADVTIS